MSKPRSTTRREFLTATTAATAVAALPRKAPAAQKRPNVLVLTTDQQAAHMMSCAGNPWLDTPAMDSLAATGTRFERAYSSNPVCLPERFSWQTGRYPSAARIRHNGSKPDEAVLAELAPHALGHRFREAGYETCYGGKVHLPGMMRDVKTCGYERVLTGDQRDGLADACVQYLKAPHEKPFLLFASFINPHDICYMAIQDLTKDSGPGKGITQQRCVEALQRPEGADEATFFRDYCPPLPANHEPPLGEPEAVEYLITLRDFRKRVREHWSDERWREHRWAYCRLTERVDKLLGRVLDALDRAGLAENTIVLFTADHGDNDASHKLEHKTVFYEEAMRVPLVVRVPGMTPAGAVDRKHLVSNGVDFLPTLCGLCGIPVEEGLPGRSIEPLLKGEDPADWREALFVEDETGFLVRTDRYKYAQYDRCKSRPWFGDLEADPLETRNLIGDRAEYGEEIARHKKLLEGFIKRYGIQTEKPGERV